MNDDSQPTNADAIGVLSNFRDNMSDLDLENERKSESESHSDHSQGSTSRSSGHTGSTLGGDRKNGGGKRVEMIGQAETVAVVRSKLALLMLLTLMTVAVSVLVHTYVKQNEMNTFRDNFVDDSRKVLESLGSTIDLTLQSVDSFLVNQMSFAAYANMTWPFVTVPDFAVKASKIRSISKAKFLSEYLILEGYGSGAASQRAEWINYTSRNDAWVESDIAIQREDKTFKGTFLDEYEIVHDVWGGWAEPRPETDVYHYPIWQSYPLVPALPPYNWDANEYQGLLDALPELVDNRRVVIGQVSNYPYPYDEVLQSYTDYYNSWISEYLAPEEDETEPYTDIFYPMVDTSASSVSASDSDDGKVVGVFAVIFYWRDMLKGILPLGSDGVVAVIENACNQTFSYQINGPNVVFLGYGDHHDTSFDDFEPASSDLNKLNEYSDTDDDALYTGFPLTEDICPYKVTMYASEAMKSRYISGDSIYFAIASAMIFVITSFFFICYDILVERRQKKVLKTATQSTAIVSSLFPSNVRDRLFEDTEEPRSKNAFKVESNKHIEPTKHKLRSMLNDGKKTSQEDQAGSGGGSRPIADLFTDCTVMFADIAGFTAWSSARSPSQVFTLLETLYSNFDRIADKRGVFKVETTGDSYVAVAGLPDPRPDHCVVMAKFASDCRTKMAQLTKDLETTLGPDTADLQIRFGLNSGPVTAGVLRGQKSRFQLFGDTVNTAARMESTGITNKIQVSQSTADLLIAAGRSKWLTPRKDLVAAKGKGTLQTYFVEPRTVARSADSEASEGNISSKLVKGRRHLDEKTIRLVDWNVDVLSRLLKTIIARRKEEANTSPIGKTGKKTALSTNPSARSGGGGKTMPLDEVVEIIELPAYKTMKSQGEGQSTVEGDDSIELDRNVKLQLREYITQIALRYNDNAFHNFDHASHVGMSVAKLMSRIVPDLSDVMEGETEPSKDNLLSTLHDHTYGITSDPLTQFTCVFSALIHDLDHSGVPNTTLVKEQHPLSIKYNGKSVAEQNSLDIAWKLLMKPKYKAFRDAIYGGGGNESEERRFRQLLVNSLMATDIMDKDLKNLRNARWEKAFDSSSQDTNNVNRKATIVIEHLIQASDVAHTMQHWHVYVKWNKRLFMEMYKAYKQGRSDDKDPSKFWYRGEIGFFDHYIIPLAKKLKECGVFGVSCDEYLNYALANRREWIDKGQNLVNEMIIEASAMAEMEEDGFNINSSNKDRSISLTSIPDSDDEQK